jgi:hypothetical protein
MNEPDSAWGRQRVAHEARRKMKANSNLVLIVVVLMTYWVGLSSASAFYDPGAQRWLNRDPLSNQGFIILKNNHPINRFYHLVFTVVGDDSHAGIYGYVNGSPVNRYDYLGLDSCPPPDCTGAPPLPSSSSACDDYGNNTYLGDNDSCFCKCAGDSQWAQKVRGCLACEFKKTGVLGEAAHDKCYKANGGIPWSMVITLGYCLLKCTAGPPAPFNPM